MDELQDTRSIPHVLIFPFPVQGHVTPMLRLAELLSFSNLKITFLNSHHNHHRLLRHSDVFSRFSRHPNFHFESISDGLPDEKHRSVDREALKAVGTVMAPLFKELLTKLVSQRESPVSCVIADGLMDFAVDITQEIRVKLVYFRIPSAAFFWVCWCIPHLIQSREFPLEDENMEQEITSIPGMENFLRRRDLPTFCRVYDLKEDLSFEAISLATQQTSRAHALILNTFDDLEGTTVARIVSDCVKVYTIGPLDAHLKHKRSLVAPKTATSNSLWEEDRGCLAWLDKRPLKSVIYVSFGSITVLTKAQLLEFWHGLVKSGRPFLWVIRPDSITGEDQSGQIPAELSEATKERGLMVGWAPQEEVLNHPAIGGFLTHSGWNSTLESIAAGVPMICWPYFADQQVNSRFVSEGWKLGLDMKDTCDRVVVEKMVRDLMEVRRDEFLESAKRMSELARKAVMEGGSSSDNLDRLIEDIRLMK